MSTHTKDLSWLDRNIIQKYIFADLEAIFSTGDSDSGALGITSLMLIMAYTELIGGITMESFSNIKKDRFNFYWKQHKSRFNIPATDLNSWLIYYTRNPVMHCFLLPENILVRKGTSEDKVFSKRDGTLFINTYCLYEQIKTMYSELKARWQKESKFKKACKRNLKAILDSVEQFDRDTQSQTETIKIAYEADLSQLPRNTDIQTGFSGSAPFISYSGTGSGEPTERVSEISLDNAKNIGVDTVKKRPTHKRKVI